MTKLTITGWVKKDDHIQLNREDKKGHANNMLLYPLHVGVDTYDELIELANESLPGKEIKLGNADKIRKLLREGKTVILKSESGSIAKVYPVFWFETTFVGANIKYPDGSLERFRLDYSLDDSIAYHGWE